jgi:hypothetical protein
VILFIASGEWSEPVTLCCDNFRLIVPAMSRADAADDHGIKVDAQKKVVISWTGGGILECRLRCPRHWNAVTAHVRFADRSPAGGLAFSRQAVTCKVPPDRFAPGGRNRWRRELKYWQG